MEPDENKVLTRERVENIKQIVESKARRKKEDPNYIEATKLILLEIAEAMILGFGKDLPSWTIQWDTGHKPLRFFAIIKTSKGQLMVHLEGQHGNASRGWIEIEKIEVEQCWEINHILNECGGAPEIHPLQW